MFDEGNAMGVAQMMLDTGKIFPAFIETLTHTQWPLRLGAMVVFEAIVEKNKSLAARVISSLWEHFERVDDRIQGDIVYVLGESGDTSVIPKLKSVLKGPHNPEVKEAAIEALEKLEQ
jgi:HEAT repeat protein